MLEKEEGKKSWSEEKEKNKKRIHMCKVCTENCGG